MTTRARRWVQTRKALHVGSDEFTWWADQLGAMGLVATRPEVGCSKGPRVAGVRGRTTGSWTTLVS